MVVNPGAVVVIEFEAVVMLLDNSMVINPEFLVVTVV